jgi:CheY-like chemotaxis protein
MATILVIDDDRLVRETITDILEVFHIDTLAASNGAEGIEIFAEKLNEIDGIIIDRRMPILGGLATLQKLREIQKDIPVIMSSGDALEDPEINMVML